MSEKLGTPKHPTKQEFHFDLRFPSAPPFNGSRRHPRSSISSRNQRGMHYQNSYRELGAYADDLIRIKARRLVGSAGFTSADFDDIQQAIALDLLVRLKNYDASRARKTTFMARIVAHCIVTLIEKRIAACRHWRRCRTSLDDPEWQKSEEGGARIQRLADPTATTSDDIAFSMDLQAALEALPEDLRRLWGLLLLDSSMSHAAREMEIPRTTLYGRLERLRKALREAGL